jgi:hypothetical protein
MDWTRIEATYSHYHLNRTLNTNTTPSNSQRYLHTLLPPETQPFLPRDHRSTIRKPEPNNHPEPKSQIVIHFHHNVQRAPETYRQVDKNAKNANTTNPCSFALPRRLVSNLREICKSVAKSKADSRQRPSLPAQSHGANRFDNVM